MTAYRGHFCITIENNIVTDALCTHPRYCRLCREVARSPIISSTSRLLVLIHTARNSLNHRYYFTERSIDEPDGDIISDSHERPAQAGITQNKRSQRLQQWKKEIVESQLEFLIIKSIKRDTGSPTAMGYRH